MSPMPLSPPQHGTNSTVCLPRLDLPTFSGNALEWQPFWDGFNAAVNLIYQLQMSRTEITTSW